MLFEEPNRMYDSGFDDIPRPEVRRELRRRWKRSLWRIIPLPILSYSIVGCYLWFTNVSDPWIKAAPPVMAITIYLSCSPIIQSWWFRRTRRQIEARNNGTYTDVT